MSFNDIKDKRVLITGAGNGLGREIAHQLSDMNARLVLSDIDQAAVELVAEEIAKKGNVKPICAKHDVANEQSWQELESVIASEFDGLDGLVNNAGIMIHKPFVETTLDDLRKTLSVNVESIFIGTKAMLPLLQKAGTTSAGSSIVNVSSVFGQVAGPMYSAYSASKGAVTLLTKALANELPRMGTKIRCNSIHPGVMDAGVSIDGMEAMLSMGMIESKEQFDAVMAMNNPIARAGKASEIPGAVAFLISDASTLINGSEIVLDGGQTQVL